MRKIPAQPTDINFQKYVNNPSIALDFSQSIWYILYMAQQEQYPILVKRKDEAIPRVIRLSKIQRDAIDIFMQTGRVSIVAKELKKEEKTFQEFLNREEIKEYMACRIRHAAGKSDLTEEKIISKVNEIVDSDGTKKYETSYLRAIEVAARILKLVQPAQTNIVNQINNNPYADMTDDELDSAIAERIKNGRNNLNNGPIAQASSKGGE